MSANFRIAQGNTYSSSINLALKRMSFSCFKVAGYLKHSLMTSSNLIVNIS